MTAVRRFRGMGILAAFIVIAFFWYSSSSSSSSDDFFISTRSALDREHKEYNTHPLGDDAALAAALAERKKDADTIARDSANVKAPKPGPVRGEKQQALVDEPPTDLRNVAGRKKYPIEGEKQATADDESSEEHDAKVELNDIFKKSPSKFLGFVSE